MGCGLRKLKPGPQEEHSPGKIYSTLKRPQVETRVGPAYTYRVLDFLIGQDGGTSTLRLSSVRELPSQLQDLYQQGFVLAALHPFIQPCDPGGDDGPERQLYRAILVKNSDGGEQGPSLRPQHRLQLEECLSADQEPTPELIQGYVKKHVQDAADQGVLFVGFIHEAQSAPCRREPHNPPSLSLHSSPSSVLGSLGSSEAPEPPPHPGAAAEQQQPPPHTGEQQPPPHTAQQQPPPHTAEQQPPPHEQQLPPAAQEEEEEEEENSAPCGSEEEAAPQRHNNNPETKDRPSGVELLALYDRPPLREPAGRYYTVKVPLSVQSSAEGGVRSLEGLWLDHLTQHFTSGASLVDGHFYLGGHLSDVRCEAAESVFIFQEPSESQSGAQAFDAIVVEQWTIIQGLQVKADYVPLLQFLASFGWRLTCVLPTPVIRTNSDGSLSTKQMVFLQRPVLSRKKKDSKRLIFKSRSKPNKNCIKESAKNKKSKRTEQPCDGRDGADTTECTTDTNTVEDRSKTEHRSKVEAGQETTTAAQTKDCEEVTENGVDSEDQSEKDQGLTAANQDAAGSQE